MKFNYSEVDYCIGRCITNQLFFDECFFVCKSDFRNNGWYQKKIYLLILILIRLEIRKGWFVTMFSSVWGTLKMMDAPKIPIGSGSDLILNKKMHQNAHNRGVTWPYDVIGPKKLFFWSASWYLILLISTLKKSSWGNSIKGNLENQPEIRNLPMP